MRSKRSAILAFTLLLSVGIAADAQSTALTLSFTGSGITSPVFLLNGNGTLTPLGTARLSINGVLTGSTTSLAFEFLFPDGSTMAAAAAATPAPGTLTGTATIRRRDRCVCRTLRDHSPFPSRRLLETTQILPFTFTGSGALGQGAICAYLLDTGGQAFPAAGGAGTVNITTAAGCPWSFPARRVGSRMPLRAPATAHSRISDFANAGADHSATMTIGGVPYKVEQEGTASPA